MSETTKHTPGPWKYAADDMRDGRYSIYHNGPIAYCGDANPNNPGDGEANARLIAAGPELLAALEDSVDALEYATQKLNDPTINGHRVLRERLQAARAAIAKARGDQ